MTLPLMLGQIGRKIGIVRRFFLLPSCSFCERSETVREPDRTSAIPVGLATLVAAIPGKTESVAVNVFRGGVPFDGQQDRHEVA